MDIVDMMRKMYIDEMCVKCDGCETMVDEFCDECNYCANCCKCYD